LPLQLAPACQLAARLQPTVAIALCVPLPRLAPCSNSRPPQAFSPDADRGKAGRPPLPGEKKGQKRAVEEGEEEGEGAVTRPRGPQDAERRRKEKEERVRRRREEVRGVARWKGAQRRLPGFATRNLRSRHGGI
jgi:hypothetical protein